MLLKFLTALSLCVKAPMLIAQADHPPAPYVAKSVCPFECCEYREWWPDKEVRLYDKPNGTIITAVVRKGEHVQGLTGEIIQPHPIRYVLPETWHTSLSRSHLVSIPAGTVIWMVGPIEEATVDVWWRGRINSYNIVQDTTVTDPKAARNFDRLEKT